MIDARDLWDKHALARLVLENSLLNPSLPQMRILCSFSHLDMEKNLPLLEVEKYVLQLVFPCLDVEKNSSTTM